MWVCIHHVMAVRMLVSWTPLMLIGVLAWL